MAVGKSVSQLLMKTMVHTAALGWRCCTQTGQRQLQEINILLLWELVQRFKKKSDPYRPTLARWRQFLVF